MKGLKKFIATILCAVLAFTAIPLPVFAAEAQEKSRFTEGIFTYEIVDGTAAIVGCDTSFSGEMTVPETLGGYDVTRLSTAFENCVGITSVTISKNVNRIQYYSFKGCKNIVRFNVVEENGYFKTDEHGVLYTRNMEILYCFPAGSGIENYTVPDGVVKIYADFDGCDKLKTITIPESIEYIKGNFSNCSNLTDIYFGGIEQRWKGMNGGLHDIPENINVHCREMTFAEKMEYKMHSLGAQLGPFMFFGFYFVIGIPYIPVALLLAFLQDLGLIHIKPY